MKFLNFFLLLWVIFALLDPDPQPWHKGISSLAFKYYSYRRGKSKLGVL
jgi:hypothetical protein